MNPLIAISSTLLVLIFSSLSIPDNLAAQSTLYTNNFETTNTYATSHPEGSDGAEDYFGRIDHMGNGVTVPNPDVVGDDGTLNQDIDGGVPGNYSTVVNGAFYFGAQDMDGYTGGSVPSTVTFEPFNINGFANFSFMLDMADKAGMNWDKTDFVRFEYAVDGGAFQNILCLENDGSTFNSPAYVDTDCDGDGNTTPASNQLTTNWTNFSFNFPSNIQGNTMQLRATLSLMAADETFFMDNLRVTGKEIVQVLPIPAMNQWGLFIFSLLVMNLSIFYVKRGKLI
ncbi:MAG: hypothetical protein AAF960_18750 [Bacteroidota bacterium]